MSHYSLDELIELWRGEKLTTEQMIGQILQVLRELERRVREAGRGAAAEGERCESEQPRKPA